MPEQQEPESLNRGEVVSQGSSPPDDAFCAEKKLARNRNQGRAKIRAREIGGPQGLEPTRFGDWERGGRCIDF